jgi:DNA invertase Pin-like site-specific DNA recombinase
MRYGYVRIATRDQSTAAAAKALRAASCGHVVREKTPASREALRHLLAQLQPEDVVVVTSFEQLAASTAELIETLTAIDAKSASFVSLADPWTGGMTPGAVIEAVGSVGRFQGAARAAGAAEGRERARAAGRFGRPPKLTPEQEKDVRRRHRAGESMRTLAAEFKVGRGTIERAISKKK